MIQLLRKITVSLFFLLHFSALIFWVFPPYASMVLNEPTPQSFISSVEKQFFRWFRHSEGELIPRVLTTYIDVIGAHQYWDFFAPEAPLVHQYLQVCGDITQDTNSDALNCINPLFQSFDGTLDAAIRSHDGGRSRSFRFTENFIRFQRNDFFELFNRYWLKQGTESSSSKLTQIYLLSSEFSIHPNFPALNLRHRRKDRVLWITVP